MTGRVARALVIHELSERVRDRWVLVVTALFVLLAAGIGLYGRSAEASAAVVTAPSIVTLATFLVPLVALVLGHDAIVGERERNTLGLLLSLPVGRGEVLVAKYVGRLGALVLAITAGLGSAALVLSPAQRVVLVGLIPATILLGAAFLSVGMLISVVARRHATAASIAVAVWFLLVLFYDLGILAALVASDGAFASGLVSLAVSLNPADLYRTELLVSLGAGGGVDELGLVATMPSRAVRAGIWIAWLAAPLGIGAALLTRHKAVRS